MWNGNNAVQITEESLETSAHLEKLKTISFQKKGLYVLSGTSQMVPAVLDHLVDLLGTESRPMGMTESRARLSSKVGQLIWIDSGNAFDAYYVAMRARLRGLDARRILRAIHVGRPFTAFQLQQMLDKVPHPSVHLSNQSFVWTPLVIISDLLGLFYDSEIRENDMHRAYRQFLLKLSYLKERALVVGLMYNHEIPLGRQDLSSRMLAMASSLKETVPLNSNEPLPYGRIHYPWIPTHG